MSTNRSFRCCLRPWPLRSPARKRSIKGAVWRPFFICDSVVSALTLPLNNGKNVGLLPRGCRPHKHKKKEETMLTRYSAAVFALVATLLAVAGCDTGPTYVLD